jgi:hypothetical protein
LTAHGGLEVVAAFSEAWSLNINERVSPVSYRRLPRVHDSRMTFRLRLFCAFSAGEMLERKFFVSTLIFPNTHPGVA